MIKTLQKRFVVTSMTAIGLLLLLIFAVLNIINAYSSYSQSMRVLNMISEREFSVLWQLPSEFGADSHSGFLHPPLDENTQLSSIYFTAYADRNGRIIYVDTSRTASLTREKAVEIAESAAASHKASGREGAYRYKSVKAGNNMGTAYVFLDMRSENANILRMLVFSAAVTAVCFALMLLLTAALSKRAIKPIAENMEKQKNFVTDAGHEIKTPLAIITANAEALELYGGENKWTNNIKEQTNRLTALMQSLLTLSRLDGSAAGSKKEIISLSDTVTGTASMFFESAALKKVKINLSVQPDITVKADREHMTRLVSVLTDNAVKYSVEESEIDISLFVKDKKRVLTIKNVCEKLPDCDSEKLFDRFYRGDSSRTQKSGGFGIGLAAARAITELYNGRISAQYKSANTIVFTVIL